MEENLAHAMASRPKKKNLSIISSIPSIWVGNYGFRKCKTLSFVLQNRQPSSSFVFSPQMIIKVQNQIGNKHPFLLTKIHPFLPDGNRR